MFQQALCHAAKRARRLADKVIGEVPGCTSACVAIKFVHLRKNVLIDQIGILRIARTCRIGLRSLVQ
jgi:hypothetical protein